MEQAKGDTPCSLRKEFWRGTAILVYADPPSAGFRIMTKIGSEFRGLRISSYFSRDFYSAGKTVAPRRRGTHGSTHQPEPAGTPEDYDRTVDGMGGRRKSTGPDRARTRVGRGS